MVARRIAERSLHRVTIGLWRAGRLRRVNARARAGLSASARQRLAADPVDHSAPAELVAFDFDERDPCVKALIGPAVAGARRNHRHSGLCGQAPSDYPEMVEYLVELGIDSISVTPDTLLLVTRNVLAVEQRLGRALRASTA